MKRKERRLKNFSAVPLQLFYHLVNLGQFTRNLNALRAMRLALATLYTMVGLTVARHDAVERNEVLTAMLAVLCLTNAHRQRTFVLTLIVMHKDGGDVNTVGTRHAILTIVAGNVFQAHNLLGDIAMQVFHLFVSQWL